MKGGLLILVVLMFVFPGFLFAQEDQTQGKLRLLEERVTNLERESEGLRKELALLKLPPLPDRLTLCDRVVPLWKDEGRERFEREFYPLLGQRGRLTILIKRYSRFFNVLSREIENAGLPADLIFLAIAESDLNPRATSPAKAGGLWQFIKDTGKREGLYAGEYIDERYAIEKSTRTALSLLTKLHNDFGDWLLAMAAYNAGESRIRSVLASQGSRDFFDLFINEETDRYVFRIAALKEVIGNPRKYGLAIEKSDYYQPYVTVRVRVESEKEISTSIFSQAMDLPYRTFRLYNLQIRKDRLPAGAYKLYVPAEKKETFIMKMQGISGITVQPLE